LTNPLTTDGLLILDKPRGLTSHEVVARVRHATKMRQAGHTGTLDPMATGVLVVCVGQATRISEYLLAHDKTYRATIRLGLETNTYDAEGQVIAAHDVNVDEATVRRALTKFIGDIRQVPPMHSAIKREGQKLYELARAGIEVERPARPVTIHAIDLLDWQSPDLTIDVKCSAGTYIRSIAHDLGHILGTGAHLIALRRTASGPFAVDEAITLDSFEALVREHQWQSRLRSIDQALSEWPVAVLTGAEKTRAMTGGPIESLKMLGTRCRAHDEQGRLLALLVFDQKKHVWRAEKVFVPVDQSTDQPID
jgi:tRNA pseudouridine55 synthase